MNPEIVTFVGQVTEFGVCSKSVGALNSALCQGEMGKVIRTRLEEKVMGAHYTPRKYEEWGWLLNFPKHPYQEFRDLTGDTLCLIRIRWHRHMVLLCRHGRDYTFLLWCKFLEYIWH